MPWRIARQRGVVVRFIYRGNTPRALAPPMLRTNPSLPCWRTFTRAHLQHARLCLRCASPETTIPLPTCRAYLQHVNQPSHHCYTTTSTIHPSPTAYYADTAPASVAFQHNCTHIPRAFGPNIRCPFGNSSPTKYHLDVLAHRVEHLP